MRYIVFLLTTTGLCLSMACNPYKNTQTTNLQTESKESIPEIAFLFFDIKKNNNEHVIELAETRFKEGTLKQSLNPNVRNPKWQLHFGFYAGDQLLFEDKIDHPLYQIMETSNEEGELRTIMNELNEAQFMYRVQRDPSITSVRFIEDVDGEDRLLNEVKLKL